MNDYTREEITALHGYNIDSIGEKWDSRPRKGGVIEEKEDGYWGSGKRGFNKKAFVVIKIPGQPVDGKYTGALYDDTDQEQLVLKSANKWRILIDDVSETIKQDLQDNNEVSLTWSNINSFVKERYLDNGDVKER